MAALLPPKWFLGVAGGDTPVRTGSPKCSKDAVADSAPHSPLAHGRSPAAPEHGTPSLGLLGLQKTKMSQEARWTPNQKAATHKKIMQLQPL